jgi:hypothetical protein
VSTPVSGPQVTLDSWLAEVGGVFTGHLAHYPPPDIASSVRGVRLELRYWTEGRGTKDSATVSVLNYPAEQGVQLSTRFTLPVPSQAPISYDGRTIRVRWQLRAVADRSWKSDHIATTDVVVAPVGAYGLYRSPHPYHHQPPPPSAGLPGGSEPPPPFPPAPPPAGPSAGPTPPRPAGW